MRKRKNMRQHKFNLDQDNATHKRLEEHLSHLAETGAASEWIISTLIAALPVSAEPETGRVVPAGSVPSTSEGRAEYTPGTSFPLVDDDDMKPARPKVQPMAPRQKTSVFQRNGAVIPPVSGAKK